MVSKNQSAEVDCTRMTDKEIEEELVQWVLERVDHWVEHFKK